MISFFFLNQIIDNVLTETSIKASIENKDFSNWKLRKSDTP